jgi:PAS domain S-box-containing protein
VLETSPLGILLVAHDGRIRWANARALDLFGYQGDELTGQPLEILVPERLRAAHVGHRATFFAQPRVRPMGLGLELAARRRDGWEFPVEISLSYTDTEHGLLALAFITDITRRREAEKRLQTEFAVTRVFADPPPLEELPARLLQAMCQGLGWDAAELWQVDGDRLRWEAGWHRAELDLGEWEVARRETRLASGSGIPGRVWADGQARWEEDGGDGDRLSEHVPGLTGVRAACAFPIRSDRVLTGVVVLLAREAREPDDTLLAMLTDIGNRVGQNLAHQRAERQLVRQRDVLYQSEKLAAMGRLVAGVAHEMNNPLGIMSSRIELMLEDAPRHGLPAEVVEDLQVLHRNTLRVARVAQALRSFARQSAGERGPVSLNAVVEETLLLARKPMTTDRIHIETRLDPALPLLLGDANALQQVLLNLLTNAQEAFAARGGVIRIETGLAPGPPDRVQVAVSDTGPGIGPADLPHVFEPFFTTKPAGTGLGLVLCRQIAEAHGGNLTLQNSREGPGCIAVLRLPTG